ncbi:uncharacterized protein BDZ99DRAFT_467553 [Mytilinidion resinicola]|uniref:Uncharacterized protein n=1 Tax=Mytilinidion resinicola TaxID=574789 RepID=A0A6A6Y8P2_9PEZI|nr:uncharacterized protein BDZ99DRAFT_467553 [Mytilinidion resinicola]KAF2804187.1 hypothetical protein BDZ99DRAFT_467553 [Mytilinidion resinicola]
MPQLRRPHVMQPLTSYTLQSILYVQKKSHHISTTEIRRILDAQAVAAAKKQHAKELREAAKLLKKEAKIDEDENKQKRKEAVAKRVELRVHKLAKEKEYKATQRQRKQVQKRYDDAIIADSQNGSQITKNAVKKLHEALLIASSADAIAKTAVDEAISAWQHACVHVASLQNSTQNSTQNAGADEMEIDQFDEQFDEEFDEEMDEEIDEDGEMDENRVLESVEGGYY